MRSYSFCFLWEYEMWGSRRAESLSTQPLCIERAWSASGKLWKSFLKSSARHHMHWSVNGLLLRLKVRLNLHKTWIRTILLARMRCTFIFNQIYLNELIFVIIHHRHVKLAFLKNINISNKLIAFIHVITFDGWGISSDNYPLFLLSHTLICFRNHKSINGLFASVHEVYVINFAFRSIAISKDEVAWIHLFTDFQKVNWFFGAEKRDDINS